MGGDASAHALPLRICKAAESFAVEDANGVALADVYFEDEPTRPGFVDRLLTFRSYCEPLAQARRQDTFSSVQGSAGTCGFKACSPRL
ncbi:hypothetical protein [Methylocystis sp.]|uniref:hypothetical protein n=1 Tax=Methylocystis sp. TaxID=1911079 RepID=UPI003D0DDF71